MSLGSGLSIVMLGQVWGFVATFSILMLDRTRGNNEEEEGAMYQITD